MVFHTPNTHLSLCNQQANDDKHIKRITHTKFLCQTLHQNLTLKGKEMPPVAGIFMA